jgi:peptidoglycan/xylan/chitin deacetylase (PgdA/CDA1 family)
MQDAGMSMGGHTVTHPILSSLEPREQRDEIETCARRIAEELGTPMRLFSYPVGWPSTFDAVTRTCLREQGVEFAFSQYGGFQRAGEWDPYDLRRATIGETTTIPVLNAMTTAPRLFARW